MDSGVVGLVKNSFDWIKEYINFLFINETRIKTVNGIINLIILFSKHPSHRKKAFLILESIFSEHNNMNYSDKTNLVKNDIQNLNSNITLISNDDEIIYFFNYINLKKISLSKITTKDIFYFFNDLIESINLWQKYIRYFSIFSILSSILLSFYFNNLTWLLLNILIFITIIITKTQKKYRFYSLIKTLPVESKKTFEESIFYQLVKEYNNNWINDIKKNNYSELVLSNETDEINEKIVNEEILNSKIIAGNIKVETLKESDILSLIKNVDKGEFKITKNLNTFENKNDALIKVLDYILINKRPEKEHIFQNIWKIVKNDTCSSGIKKWLNSNKNHISEIINETSNKKNILHLFSYINKTKETLFNILNEKNRTSNNAIISNLNDIQDTVLENMSLDNFINIFEVIESSKETNKPIVLINSKV